MAVIPVDLAGRPYEVRVESGLVSRLAEECAGLLRKSRVPIITDRNVHSAYGAAAEASFAGAGKQVAWRILPPGEQTKGWQELAATVDWLLAEEVERNDHVIALGGGVIGDFTGFASAILKRGCKFIQVPTTLLAQVDSSVGGKTAINTAAGKNLVGAFHQPSLVLADPDTLDTLPRREVAAGYAEVVKYGLLGDAEFFAWCEVNGASLLAGDSTAREYAIATSVAAKARIVAEDEFETTGQRALLNLGHTFGHALEAQTGFGDRLLHGEGVALGMVLAARYSARRGLLAAGDAARIAAHFSAIGMPHQLSALGLNCNGRTLTAHMLHDKKMDAGTLPFILMRGIGSAFVAKDVELADVARFLDEELAA
ncbi:MAG: 3-dehydroquinate synthase [Novosphingobium sp.]